MTNSDRYARYYRAIADQVVCGQHDADAYAARFAKGRALQVRPFPWPVRLPPALPSPAGLAVDGKVTPIRKVRA